MRRKLLLGLGLALIAAILAAAGCAEKTDLEPENSQIVSPGAPSGVEPGGEQPIASLGVPSSFAETQYLPLFGADSSSQQVGIWVAGQGQVTVVPDVAIISLGIEAQAMTVADARSQAAEAMEGVMNALTANKVASKDIKTQYFSIYPLKRWDEKTQREALIGYQVSNMVTAKIRNVDDAGVIIDAVALAGGDLARIQGISFTVDDPTSYYSQARQQAVLDAKAKAEQMAALTGVTLGKPIYITESGGYISTPYSARALAMAEEKAATTPISPGEMEISITVQIVFAIQ